MMLDCGLNHLEACPFSIILAKGYILLRMGKGKKQHAQYNFSDFHKLLECIFII